MGPTVRSLAARYGFATLAVTVAVLARLLLDPLLEDRLPLLLIALAVVAVAWHGGFGPSILALLLGIVGGTYFFLAPRHSLAESLAGHAVQTGGFLVLGLTIGLFSERLRAARRRAEAHAAEAIRQRQELEQEVAWRKRLEEELQRRAEELAEADRRKDEFLATLAHELRNPLAPIRNAVQLLRLKGPADAQAQAANDMIDRQVGQMVRLVDDLLDVSRITRGKVQLRKERVGLAAVLRSAVETVRPFLEACGHELAVVVPPQPVVLLADPVRLAQVIANLLNNAAKYTDRGGHIRLSAERRGGDVVVAVSDDGIGIAAEHLPRVFEMFSQVAPALERSQGGLGIGLSLVRALVEMHGGTVEAHSPGPGRGSTFVVRLPLPASVPTPEPLPPGHAENGADRTSHRILVVDDNRDAAESLGMLLRLMGHDTRAAHDGLEALTAAERFRPDVVLLDIGLPKLNGYEAARHIRAQPWGRTVLLVAITGWGQEDDKRRALEAGFDHHLTKPVAAPDLAKVLAEFRRAGAHPTK